MIVWKLRSDSAAFFTSADNRNNGQRNGRPKVGMQK